MASENTNCPLSSMTLSTLVVLLVEQCVSNVTREHDFKVLFKMSQIFFARASGACEGLFIQFLCGGRGDYPFVSTYSFIEVTVLLISSQKYHFSVQIRLNVSSAAPAALARCTIHIFGRGRAKKRVFVSPCVWSNIVFL